MTVSERDDGPVPAGWKLSIAREVIERWKITQRVTGTKLGAEIENAGGRGADEAIDLSWIAVPDGVQVTIGGTDYGLPYSVLAGVINGLLEPKTEPTGSPSVSKQKQKVAGAKRVNDVETLTKLVDQYEEVFGEVEHFIKLIARQETDISERHRVMIDAKEKYDAAKAELESSREARDGTKHALFMFLRPGPSEILPLFDRMEKADERKHGAHAEEWRKEPISALRLSLIATGLLTAADVIFVGQLQDRVQEDGDDWFDKIEGITAPMAAAIADKLNDFIAEHAGK